MVLRTGRRMPRSMKKLDLLTALTFERSKISRGPFTTA